jgi:A/G-specific adenine glycosylase
MPWRSRRTPYRVFVSEIMLQQTGISRVTGHYLRFLRLFPSFRALASAPVARVLAAWKGLGYNRRALALRESARLVIQRHGGKVPRTRDELMALPGVGRATAGAVIVYAFDLPVPFIETNVRRVFLHFYFPRARDVDDRRILPLVERTMDRRRPREWFYALMDYGTMLAREGVNANRRSSAYTRQAAFEGSRRQLRGRVLGVILTLGSATTTGIRREMARSGFNADDPRLAEALESLAVEGFLQKRRERFSLK